MVSFFKKKSNAKTLNREGQTSHSIPVFAVIYTGQMLTLTIESYQFSFHNSLNGDLMWDSESTDRKLPLSSEMFGQP